MNMDSFLKLLLSIALCTFLSNLSAFEFTNSKWPSSTMEFDYDLVLSGNSSSPSGISWNQAFDDAADAWNTQTSFNIVTDTSDPSNPCAGVDGFPADGFRNGVAFYHEVCFQGADPSVEEFGERVLAVTLTYTFTSTPDETVETDLFFNNAEGWDVYDGSLRRLFDFKRVAKHELGHVLGLGHEEVATALMNPTVGNIYTLQPDDLAGAAALYGAVSNDPPIMISVEEPFDGSVQSGISTFRGWVVSLHGIVSLELFQDGVSKGQLQHAGGRADVCLAHPAYPDCANSGFAFAESWGLVGNGNHTYRLDARDFRGNILSETVTFDVSNYDDAFVANPDLISLSNATISKQGEDILVRKLMHNGKEYDLRMRWRKKSQDFEPVEIIRTQ